jgi:hypothetical protein
MGQAPILYVLGYSTATAISHTPRLIVESLKIMSRLLIVSKNERLIIFSKRKFLRLQT